MFHLALFDHKNQYILIEQKKLEKLMCKMKEQIMESTDHRLEGDLHDYNDENDKLSKCFKTLQDRLKEGY